MVPLLQAATFAVPLVASESHDKGEATAPLQPTTPFWKFTTAFCKPLSGASI